jgi:dephospho-CoA kinase
LRSTVVGLAGPIGSGKTSVALGVASALECPVVSFGNYVRELAAQTGRGNSREVFQEISEQLMASLGPHGLTRNVLASQVWDRKHSLVVDGIRHPEVVVALREEAAPLPVILVYLDVRSKIRHERLVARDNLSAREIDGFEVHSTERDVGTRVRALADVVVTADGQVDGTVARVMNAIYSVLG